MTSELKAAAIVAIHGNDDAAFVELEPKSVKPMSYKELVAEIEKAAWETELGSTVIAIEDIIDITKRYADSQRGM